MPWKKSSVVKERERFAVLALKEQRKFAQLCREFGISRQQGYKWRKRFQQEGRRGLADRPRGPRQPRQPQGQRWRQKALRLRRAHRHWGGEKIRVKLAEKYGGRGLPSARTLERWFVQAGLSKQSRRRARKGPAVPHPGLTVPCRRHQVWTVDFKGWYRTGDGQRQEPLTTREMHTRYALAIRLLADQSDAAARAAFVRIFREHGLPEAIRVDNGAPFGGCGALGLTRLSVWWLRLGIRVEFIRRARPGDNAGHEQFHGLYAREVAAQPSTRRWSEQRRADRWRKEYNEQRPHEALQQRTPAQFYKRSPRIYPAKLPPVVYPARWEVRRVRPPGHIKWQGRLRFVGRAFVGEKVGLKVLGSGQWAVYLGKLLLGHLHLADLAGMRPARWQRSSKARRKHSPAGNASLQKKRRK
jgi:putative transposase